MHDQFVACPLIASDTLQCIRCDMHVTWQVIVKKGEKWYSIIRLLAREWMNL